MVTGTVSKIIKTGKKGKFFRKALSGHRGNIPFGAQAAEDSVKM
jgi:hypothetical protein